MVWIQIRTNILLVLILVQTVCKVYQQTTKVVASNERVNDIQYEFIASHRVANDFVNTRVYKKLVKLNK